MKRTLFLWIIILCSCSVNNYETNVIAHRGLWEIEGSAQNSIQSLIESSKSKTWGCEFDVNMTQDSIVIISHGPMIDTLEICKTSFQSINSILLPNSEYIPTLKEFLTEAKNHPNIRLVLEIKESGDTIHDIMCTRKIVRKVEKMELGYRTDYISFGAHIVDELIVINSEHRVFYLLGNWTPQQVKERGCIGIKYNIADFKKNPHWIEEAKNISLEVSVWTLNKSEEIEWALDMGVDYITTDKVFLAQEIIANRKKTKKTIAQ